MANTCKNKDRGFTRRPLAPSGSIADGPPTDSGRTFGASVDFTAEYDDGATFSNC
jgi:hypothetical protein